MQPTQEKMYYVPLASWYASGKYWHTCRHFPLAWWQASPIGYGTHALDHIDSKFPPTKLQVVTTSQLDLTWKTKLQNMCFITPKGKILTQKYQGTSKKLNEPQWTPGTRVVEVHTQTYHSWKPKIKKKKKSLERSKKITHHF